MIITKRGRIEFGTVTSIPMKAESVILSQFCVVERTVLRPCGRHSLLGGKIVFNALRSGDSAMQTLNADCEIRLRVLAREFRVAASSVVWSAERFRTYAEMLDQIALEIVIDDDGFDTNR